MGRPPLPSPAKVRKAPTAPMRKMPTKTHQYPHPRRMLQHLTTAHSPASQHLQTPGRARLKKSNGGRWPILSMDLGNGPVRDFDTQLKVEREHTFHQTHENRMGGTPSPTPPSTGEEGMQDYKSDMHYTTNVPDYLLPPEDRPQHCKPDIIRAVGYTLSHPAACLSRT